MPSSSITQQTKSPQWLVGKPKFLLPALLVLGLPVGYIIKKHMDWKPNPDSKKRMLIHHLTFWPLFFAGIGLGHNARKVYKTSVPKTTGWLTVGIGLMLVGFEGGDRLAHALVPKMPKPSAAPPQAGWGYSASGRPRLNPNSAPFARYPTYAQRTFSKQAFQHSLAAPASYANPITPLFPY